MYCINIAWGTRKSEHFANEAKFTAVSRQQRKKKSKLIFIFVYIHRRLPIFGNRSPSLSFYFDNGIDDNRLRGKRNRIPSIL